MKHIKKVLIFVFIITILTIWVELMFGQKKIEVTLMNVEKFDEDAKDIVFDKEDGNVIPKIIITENAIKFISNKGITKVERIIQENKFIKVAFSKNKKVLTIMEGKGPNSPCGDEGESPRVYTVMDNNGNVLRTLNIYAGYRFYISDDGKNIMYVTNPGTEVRLVDVYSKEKKVVFSQEEAYPGSSYGDFSDNSKLFALNTGYYVILYDTQEFGRELWRYKIVDEKKISDDEIKRISPIGRVQISPDGKYILATVSYAIRNSRWLLTYYFLTLDGQLLWSRDEELGPCWETIIFSPDSRYVALDLPNSQMSSRIGVFETTTGIPIWIYAETNPDLAPIPMGLKLSNNAEYLLACMGPNNGYESNKYHDIRYIYLFDNKGNKVWVKEFDVKHYRYFRVGCVSENWMRGLNMEISDDGKQIIVSDKKQLCYFNIQK